MTHSTKFVWAMMLFSSFFYVALAYMLSSGLVPLDFPDVEDKDIFAMVFGVVSVTSLALAYTLPTRLTKLPPFNAALLRFALIEAVGLLGLIYVLQTGDFNRGMFFFGTCFLGILIAFPKEEEKTY